MGSPFCFEEFFTVFSLILKSFKRQIEVKRL